MFFFFMWYIMKKVIFVMEHIIGNKLVYFLQF